MHDRNGKKLEVGDIVKVEFTVKALHATEDYCNVDLETVYGRRPDNNKERVSSINTGVVEKVD